MARSGHGILSRLTAAFGGRRARTTAPARPAVVRPRPAPPPPAVPPAATVSAEPPIPAEEGGKLPLRWDEVDPSLRETLSERVAGLDEMPLQTVQLMTELENPDADPAAIAKLAATEPGIVAEVFRIVNSAFFGLRAPVGDLRRAILLLGYNRLKFIALRLGMNRSVPADSRAGARLAEVWRHSFLASEALQGLSRAGCDDAAEAYTATLLHDLGKVLRIDLALDEGLASNVEYDSDAVPMEDRAILEDDCFGVHHGVLGALLGERLQLPPAVLHAQRLHHYPIDRLPPEAADPAARASIATVKLASLLARRFENRAGDGADREDGGGFAEPDLGPYRVVFPRLPPFADLVAAVEPDLVRSRSLLNSLG